MNLPETELRIPSLNPARSQRMLGIGNSSTSLSEQPGPSSHECASHFVRQVLSGQLPQGFWEVLTRIWSVGSSELFR